MGLAHATNARPYDASQSNLGHFQTVVIALRKSPKFRAGSLSRTPRLADFCLQRRRVLPHDRKPSLLLRQTFAR